ncbi:MFS transporter [Kitasatospora sp. NPDC093806]|uniref:MFS transporter n=1 Tax=Kitasatospora sp. NPDC093806 TaxID=3155075 RepID=UPI0034450EEC
MDALPAVAGLDAKPRLFTTPWWWRWALGTCFARITEPMATLALISLGTYVSGYAYGAFLVSVYTLTGALTATAAGRVLDRAGNPRRVLAVMAVSSFLLHVALALLGTFRLSSAVVTVTTALCAALPGGLPGLSRSVLVEYADARLRALAFSWDSIMTEVGWILGPVVIAGLSTFHLPWIEVAAMAATFLGVHLFLGPLVGTGPAAPRPGGDGAGGDSAGGDSAGGDGGTSRSLWSHRLAWPSLADSVAVGMAVTGIVSALPVLLARTGASTSWAGILVSVLAATGIAGTLCYGKAAPRITLHITVQSFLTLVAVMASVAALVWSRSMTAVAVWVGVSGFFITPFNTQRSISLEASIPAGLRTQGFSAQFALFGLGSAISAGVLALVGDISSALLLIAAIGLSISAAANAAVRKRIAAGGGR